ncbi:MAG: efflux RND transporter periplasmic adaptor subunit [Legionellaceae bacterium]|nr:efflux RND transporter periplasmic adaptor subunit [Legionellaceae bacterium]
MTKLLTHKRSLRLLEKFAMTVWFAATSRFGLSLLSRNYIFRKICLIVCISLGLIACEKPKTPQHTSIQYKVHTTTLKKTLNFTGTVQPLRENTITSPMNAVIESMHFHYGQLVKQGDTIFTLNSAELQREYNDTLTDYLKAKDNHDITVSKFAGTQELWKAGLLSKNTYLSEKSSLNTSHITLMQSTRKLFELIEKIDEDQHEDLSNLSFEEFDKVRLALSSKHSLIHLKTPLTGILLYPPKLGAERLERLNVGSSIKTGQVLALIGDLSGIRIEVDIPEVDVADVSIGMPATIHGLAFGKQPLQGKLVALNAEASTGNGNALPSFTGIIEVRHLNDAQQVAIKVGMSANIELILHRSNTLAVPIDAVQQEAGHSVVYIMTKKGVQEKRIIKTGAVNGDLVEVESGLNVDEVIVYESNNVH